jgi:hypothetical protein
MMKIKFFIFLFFLLSSGVIMAATLPGGGATPDCWPDPCPIPLDGGVSLLLAAGAAFGTKKILDSRKK